MKVLYIIPGSGDQFYCENCLRDMPLVRQMSKNGINTSIIPLYLPLFIDEEPLKEKVFYGAINTYLKENFSLFRILPDFIRRFFDMKPFLKLASGLAGATSAVGLEDMTLSLLNGDDKRQKTELERLLKYLGEESKLDIIHISNALLIGLGVKLKEHLNIPLICSLQDEDTWLDSMRSPYKKMAWDILGKNAKKTDMFLPVSQSYNKIMSKRIPLNKSKSRVVPIGLDIDRYKIKNEPLITPAIGYLSRLTKGFGLDILAEAYIETKKVIPGLKLYIAGGYTAGDKQFVKKIKSILRVFINSGDVIFLSDFHIDTRNYFFKQISLLCVPMLKGEAFGTYQIEAMACGVPVLQPDVGAFPEIISNTGGGEIFSPNDSHSLAKSLITLLSDDKKLESLGKKGRDSVLKTYTIKHMATNIERVYKDVIDDFKP